MSVLLPPSPRLALWGMMAGSLSIYIYWRLSPRDKIDLIRSEMRAAQKAMLTYEGDFAGLLRAARRSIGLSLRRFALTVGPAAGASLPGLCLIPFLDSSYSYQLVQSGTLAATPGGWATIFFACAAVAALSLRKLLGVK